MEKNNIIPFTYDWWMKVGQKAFYIAENYAYRTYMYDIADYCKERAWDSLGRKKS